MMELSRGSLGLWKSHFHQLKLNQGGAVVRALACHQCGDSNPGVDAICRLSLLLVLSLAPRGFLWVLRFSPLLKNQHFEIPIQSGMHRHVPTSSWELLIAPWVNKLQWQYKSHEHSLSWLKMEIGQLALTRLCFTLNFYTPYVTSTWP